jgi:hypothetical protein
VGRYLSPSARGDEEDEENGLVHFFSPCE